MTITEVDCLRGVCERCLDGMSRRCREIGRRCGSTSTPPPVSLSPPPVSGPEHVRNKISCDGLIQPVWETDGVPFSVGRAQHIVPNGPDES